MLSFVHSLISKLILYQKNLNQLRSNCWMGYTYRGIYNSKLWSEHIFSNK